MSNRIARIGVVVATRNRRRMLLSTLDRLQSLPESPSILVVDNASTDGTSLALAGRDRVEVVTLADNRGASARTVGVRALETPYVAFSDDDSWWAPGALDQAVAVLDRNPALGLIAARILVGPDKRLEPTCEAMERSPLGRNDGAGAEVLGFVACGAVVRRAAFLEAGGFHGRFDLGGEERLLAIDLAANGWRLAYVPEVVAYHHPAPAGDRHNRFKLRVRNDLWSAWLRRPMASAARETARAVSATWGDAETRAGVAAAVRGLPWVMRERRVVSPEVESSLRALDHS